MAEQHADADQPPGALTVQLSEDWAAQTADAIERTVGSIRDKTTVPLDQAARWIVYGLLASLLSIAAAVLLGIASVRAADQVMPVWVAYAIVSGLFTTGGLFCWSRRRPRP